ncbi:MAG: hypothetical protein SOZ34_09725 [Clostridia bacterium]|nr:hypothetical protein [Clostridia bacterium]
MEINIVKYKTSPHLKFAGGGKLSAILLIKYKQFVIFIKIA